MNKDLIVIFLFDSDDGGFFEKPASCNINKYFAFFRDVCVVIDLEDVWLEKDPQVFAVLVQLHGEPGSLGHAFSNIFLIKRIKDAFEEFGLEELCVGHELIDEQPEDSLPFGEPAVHPTRLYDESQLLASEKSHSVFDLVGPFVGSVNVQKVGQGKLVDAIQEVLQLRPVALVQVHWPERVRG